MTVHIETYTITQCPREVECLGKKEIRNSNSWTPGNKSKGWFTLYLKTNGIFLLGTLEKKRKEKEINALGFWSKNSWPGCLYFLSLQPRHPLLESFIWCFVYIYLILYKSDRMSRRIYNNTIFFISLQRLGNFWSMWHSHSFRVKQHLAAFIKWLNILNSSCLYLHRPSRLILLSFLSKPVSIRICHSCLHLWVINRHVKMQNNWCSLGGIGWSIWGF